MRLHTGMTGQDMTTTCRALVGGFGKPGMRDLDFGRQVVDCLQQLDWPDGVVVEDLSCAVPLVLHRLQELRPATVVLLGAVHRGLDRPGTLRRYRVDPGPSDPAQVHRGLEESISGLADLDHTLAVARHWGNLPADTVVIEVEPAETTFGLGFSEELAACIDPILDMVREELGDVVAGAGLRRDFAVADLSPDVTAEAAVADPQPAEPGAAMADLVGYARRHAQARRRTGRAPLLVDGLFSAPGGVALAGRVRPWGVFLESGGDWFDAVPLGDGRLGIVVGNVLGRGAEAAATMTDLRAAVRAYVVVEGRSPARLVGHVDRLAGATGLGHRARLLYLTLDPASGEVRFTNAGSCPPLLLGGDPPAGRFVDAARSAPVGESSGVERPEGTLRLGHDSTLFLFTDGLVESRGHSRAGALERLRRAAVDGPAVLEDLCDHLLDVCTRSGRTEDDTCLVGVRLAAEAMPAQARPSLGAETEGG